ncbi:MAG: Gfo/Idh/MocA family oxidoreductase [Kiritimatiellaeota bacterium]|nr:Gfo/Idh/MocA family oxidoreductase [Kiritimatiellota bacterium]
MRTSITRRSFLQRAAAAAAFSIVPRAVLGGPGYTPPSERLTKAVIGVGGMGMGHLDMGGTKLLAVCDVDEGHLKAALAKGGPDVKGYRDFREVLARPDIDIIHIPTPPHWHALISIAAAEAGKDIWCEKPMARTIGESRQVKAAVLRHGRMFRLNTWFRFEGSLYGMNTPPRMIKKAVMHGLLGWPLKVTVGAHQGFNWKLELWQGQTGLKPETVPAGFDYDFWLGPAPWKPYARHRTHQSFRGYWDYDGGGLGDMGMHYLDPVQYILDKDDTSPVVIEADTPLQHPDAARPWRRIRMRYADGCEIILDGDNSLKDAPYIEGPNGKIFKNFKSDIANLEQQLRELPEPAPQQTDFADAVRRRIPFALNESNGHRSCTLVNLAVIAVRLGRPLRYDPVAEQFIGDEAANRLIDQPMRASWSLGT